jgi:hypothetical protein
MRLVDTPTPPDAWHQKGYKQGYSEGEYRGEVKYPRPGGEQDEKRTDDHTHD